jgi:hypothetical protein
MWITGYVAWPAGIGEVTMATKFKWSDEKIAQFEREGRGKGSGASYKPWVQISDFSSRGISRRAFSPKCARHHHLLSNLEWHIFLLLEFSQEVVDIREQFPLTRDETLSIAAKLGIKHPVYPGTHVPAVMTTDFLVKFNRNGADTLEAFSAKTAADLEKPRVLEKLEIERSYFLELGVPHRLVIDSELPVNKVKNLAWIRGANLEDNGIAEYPEAFAEYGRRLAHELGRPPGKGTLAEYCANFDARVGAQPGTGLLLARALLWDGTLKTDLNQPDLPATPVAMFQTVLAVSPALRLVGG